MMKLFRCVRSYGVEPPPQGVIAPKDAAAAWAMARLDEDNGFLLDLARRGYLGHCEDSWTGKQAELEALMATMKQAIEESLAEES